MTELKRSTAGRAEPRPVRIGTAVRRPKDCAMHGPWRRLAISSRIGRMCCAVSLVPSNHSVWMLEFPTLQLIKPPFIRAINLYPRCAHVRSQLRCIVHLVIHSGYTKVYTVQDSECSALVRRAIQPLVRSLGSTAVQARQHPCCGGWQQLRWLATACRIGGCATRSQGDRHTPFVVCEIVVPSKHAVWKLRLAEMCSTLGFQPITVCKSIISTNDIHT